ncbi:MAG: hypothetical protein IJR99_01630 [Kiritimatiellae bacterium]|nr:hypothetical protein [Kiritimatiellia bacterium]
MKTEEKKQWLDLYHKINEVAKLTPWEWLRPVDIFGIQPIGREEPIFAWIDKRLLGGLPCVRFLLGWNAINEMLTRVQSPQKPVVSWLLEIPALEVLFLTNQQQYDYERRLLKQLRKQPPTENECAPVFRSIRPGFLPWKPDPEERELLSVLLYQTLGVLLRTEQNKELLTSHFPDKMLVIRQREDGTWRDTWEPVRTYEDKGIAVRLPSHFIQQFQQLRLLSQTTVQLDFLPIPTQFPRYPRKRPPIRNVLILVDTKTEKLSYGPLISGQEGIETMWNQLPCCLLTLFQNLGGCPGSIEVKGERIANFFRALEIYLPFKLVRRTNLQILDEALQRLLHPSA